MRIFDGIGELKAAEGEELGTSDWVVVDQQKIDLFAYATGDHQWIHVDTDKAADGPFGGTIAHGLQGGDKPACVVESIVRYIA